MNCPKCGKTINDNSKFCGYCGKKFNNKAPATITLNPPVNLNPPVQSSASMPQNAKCKYCGSSSLQAMKKGVSVGTAVVGAILVGPLGLAAGASGMNDVKIICLNCKKEQ